MKRRRILHSMRSRGLLVACGAAALAIALWMGGGTALEIGKARLAPILIKQAWADAVERGGSAMAPWPWADTRPVLRMTMPRLNIEQFILEGANDRALAFGPVLSTPGGMPVVFGHRDTHFAFLENVRVNDRLLIQTLNGPPVAYRIREIAVRHADDIAIVSNGIGDAPLVLVTCFPFHALDPGGPLRYVLLAERERGLGASSLPVL